MLVEVKYEIGQRVFLSTDPEQRERLITGINIRPGEVSYCLSCGTLTSWHYDFEMEVEKDVVKSTNS